ncbi:MULTISPECIES: DUF998 domain-containing protein [Methylomonas]|uniref:DUF998 domain-containing protein n=2 Tax=Methylomonas TaxID=416 RepID=A0A126T4W5_9GAMM|nr:MULTISPECIES: DUF998 domain-containing protein [Methylomonas]AMK77116.1 hypothetical protein JT25_011580 [Methylomonas denitrificans]OAH97143.1 hypothetical protein A1342_20835 [Methylomonas methanica]TCV82626.1 uncharacterized protein DUF998 [Methylomonas methanica]
MNLHRLGICCGIAAPVIWLSLIGLAGAMRPEFSHSYQYISELGERGSVTEIPMRYIGFEFTGFLYLCFAVALPATLGRDWRSALVAALIGLDGLGRIGAGIFACDPGCAGLSSSQELHRLFAMTGFSAAILAAIACGIVFRRDAWLGILSVYSIGSGLLAAIFLLLMTWEANPMETPGLFEHLATSMLSIWLLVFAARLSRTPARRME